MGCLELRPCTLCDFDGVWSSAAGRTAAAAETALDASRVAVWARLRRARHVAERRSVEQRWRGVGACDLRAER